MKSFLVNCQNENIEDDEESAEDVGVTFDGFRIGLSFEDGGKYNMIFDQFLSALNRMADDAGWEEQAVEELEQLLKAARKMRDKTK